MDELIFELGLQLQEMVHYREKIMLKVGFVDFGLTPGVSEAVSAANLVYDTANMSLHNISAVTGLQLI